MAHHDYIPQNDAEFDLFFKNLVQYVSKMCTIIPPATAPEWDHIPVAARTKLVDSYSAWYTAYVPTRTPHIPSETLTKNQAKAASCDDIRRFVNRYLRDDPVTDAQRVDMGIHNRDPHPNPKPKPPTRPEFRLAVKATRLIDVHFKDEGSETKGKPDDYDGAVIYWAIAAAPVINPEELPRSVLATRTPHTLEFAENDRGKTLSVALCWQNGKGWKGSPTEVQTAIIP
jgi:hypothetical protein